MVGHLEDQSFIDFRAADWEVDHLLNAPELLVKLEQLLKALWTVQTPLLEHIKVVIFVWIQLLLCVNLNFSFGKDILMKRYLDEHFKG